MDTVIVKAKEVAEEVHEEEAELTEDYIVKHNPGNIMAFGTSGSEPYLRSDEAICPVTNLTYFKAMGRSPYVDENGRFI